MDKLTVYTFGPRLAQAKLACKDHIADFVKKTYFEEKLTSIKRMVTLNKTTHA